MGNWGSVAQMHAYCVDGSGTTRTNMNWSWKGGRLRVFATTRV
jgi:hypothetical protein